MLTVVGSLAKLKCYKFFLASIFPTSNSGGNNPQNTQPQLNNNANNSNNNVAGPVPTQRRWVPPSRDRRIGGDARTPQKGIHDLQNDKILNYKVF